MKFTRWTLALPALLLALVTTPLAHAGYGDAERSGGGSNELFLYDPAGATVPAGNLLGASLNGYGGTLELNNGLVLCTDDYPYLQYNQTNGGEQYPCANNSAQATQLNVYSYGTAAFTARTGQSGGPSMSGIYSDEKEWLTGKIAGQGIYEHSWTSAPGYQTLQASDITPIADGDSLDLQAFLHNPYSNATNANGQPITGAQVTFNWGNQTGTIRTVTATITAPGLYETLTDTFTYEVADPNMVLVDPQNPSVTNAVRSVSDIGPCEGGATTVDLKLQAFLPPAPTYQIDKTITSTGPYTIGDVISYQVIIDGATDTINTITVSDDFAEQFVSYVNGSATIEKNDGAQQANTTQNLGSPELTWFAGTSANPDLLTLAPNEQIIITYDVVVTDLPAQASQQCDLPNTVTATSDNGAGSVSDTATAYCEPDTNPVSALSIAKQITNGAGPFAAGDEVRYEVTLTVTEGTPEDIEIIDLMSPYVTYEPDSAEINGDDQGVVTDTSNSGELRWASADNPNTLQNLSAGDVVTIEYVTTVNDALPTSACVIANTVTATASNVTQDANDTATATTNCGTPASWTMDKLIVNEQASYAVGDTIEYAIELSISAGMVPDLVVTDVLPSYVTYNLDAVISQPGAPFTDFDQNTNTLTWTAANNPGLELDANTNTSVTITYSATVTSTPAAGTTCTITNNATAASEEAGTQIDSETVTCDNTVDPGPASVAISKALNQSQTTATAPYDPFDTLYYTLVVSAEGGEPANVTVTDVYNFSHLSYVGGSTTITEPGGAVISGTAADPAQSPAGTLTWDANTQNTFESLQEGEEIEITYALQVTTPPTDDGDGVCPVNNMATVNAANADSDISNASIDIDCAGDPVPTYGYSINKTVQNEQAQYGVDDTIQYAITLTLDAGSDPITDIVLTDVLPAGVSNVIKITGPGNVNVNNATATPIATFSNIVLNASNSPRIITYTVDVTQAALDASVNCQMTNTVNATSVVADNQGPVGVTVNGDCGVDTPTLGVSKSVNDALTTATAPYVEGDRIYYTIVVSAANGTLNNIVVTDVYDADHMNYIGGFTTIETSTGVVLTPPAAEPEQNADGTLTWNSATQSVFDALADGETITITYRMRFNTTPADDGDGLCGIDNTVTANADNADSDTRTAVITVNCGSDTTPPTWSLTKALATINGPAAPTPPVTTAGDVVGYLIQTEFVPGTDDTTQLFVTITDTYPTQFLTPNTLPQNCTDSVPAGTITCTNVQAGTGVLLNFTVNDDAPAGQFCNTATGTSDTFGVTPGLSDTGTACATNTVATDTPQPLIDKSIVSIGGVTAGVDGAGIYGPAAAPHEMITYEIAVTTTDGSQITDLTILDTFDPSAFMVVSASNGGQITNGQITWTGVTAPTTLSVTLKVVTESTAGVVNGNQLCNTASLKYGGAVYADTACAYYTYHTTDKVLTAINGTGTGTGADNGAGDFVNINNLTVQAGDVLTYQINTAFAITVPNPPVRPLIVNDRYSKAHFAEVPLSGTTSPYAFFTEASYPNDWLIRWNDAQNDGTPDGTQIAVGTPVTVVLQVLDPLPDGTSQICNYASAEDTVLGENGETWGYSNGDGVCITVEGETVPDAGYAFDKSVTSQHDQPLTGGEQVTFTINTSVPDGLVAAQFNLTDTYNEDHWTFVSATGASFTQATAGVIQFTNITAGDTITIVLQANAGLQVDQVCNAAYDLDDNNQIITHDTDNCVPYAPQLLTEGIALTKTVVAPAAASGGTAVEFLIETTVPADVDGPATVTIIDSFNPNHWDTTTATATHNGTNYSATGGQFVIPNVTAGDSISVMLTALSYLTSTQICNDVFVQGDATNNAQACVPYSTEAVPGLSISKTGPQSVQPGTPFDFTLVVTNTGQTDLTDVVVTDALANYLTFISASDGGTASGQTVNWTLAQLAQGAEQTLTLTAQLNPSASLPQPDATCLVRLSNTASATAGDVSDIDNHDFSTPGTCTTPSFAAHKTANPPAGTTVNVGDEIEYTITVTNTGSVPLQTVTITDVLMPALQYTGGNTGVTASGQTVTLTFADLQPGETADLSFTVDVLSVTDTAPAYCPLGHVIGNEITTAVGFTSASDVPVVGGTTGQPCHPTDTAQPALSLSKQLVTTGPFEIGDAVQFHLIVTNDGDVPLTGVIVSDLLPDAFAFVSSEPTANTDDAPLYTWAIGSLAIDEQVVITLNTTLTPQMLGYAPHDGSICVINKAMAESDQTPDQNASAPVCVDAPTEPSGFTVTKTSQPPAGTAVRVGDSIVYTLTAVNTGETTLTITTTDALQSDLTFVTGDTNVQYDESQHLVTATFVDVPAGETVALSFTVKLETMPEGDPAKVCNVIETSIAQTPNDAYVTGMFGIDPLCHPVVQDPDPAFTLTKTADVQSAVLGAPVVYTLTLTNTGGVALTDATITDALPDYFEYVSAVPLPDSSTDGVLVWNLDTVPVGDAVSVSLTVTINDTALDQDPDAEGKICLPNVATATTSETGIDQPETASDIVCLDQVDGPAFTLTKTTDSDQVAVNDDVLFVLTVTNTGDVPLTNIEIKDQLPEYFDFVSSTPPLDIPTETRALAWTFPGAVAPGASVSVQLTVTVNDLALNVTPDGSGIIHLPNVATATTTETGDEVQTDDDEVIIVPVGTPGLQVVKTAVPAPGSVLTIGEIIEYSLTVTNTGDVALTEVTLLDVLQDDVQYVPELPNFDHEAITADGQALTVIITDLAAGASQDVTFPVRIVSLPDNTENEICNTISFAVGTTVSDETVSLTDPVVEVCHFVMPPPAGFEVVKAAANNNAELGIGDAFTFTLTATNTDQIDLTDVTVIDTLPAGVVFIASNGDAQVTSDSGVLTVDFGALNQNQTKTVTITIETAAEGTHCNGVDNLTATASHDNGTGSVSGDISGQVCVTATAAPQLTIVKSASLPEVPQVIPQSAALTYTITVTNTGDTAVTNVIVEDALPTDKLVVFVSAITPGVTYPKDGTDNVLVADVGTIEPGASAIVEFLVTGSYRRGAQWSNTATLTADGFALTSNTVTHQVAGIITTTGGTTGSTDTSTDGTTTTTTTGGTTGSTTGGSGGGGGGGGGTTIFVPSQPFCQATVCPACIKEQQLDISKQVKDASGQWFDDTATVAFGEMVGYRATLDFLVTNNEGYEITAGDVYFYDVTVPSESGGLTDRSLTDTAGYNWANVGGDADQYHLQLTGPDLNSLNRGRAVQIPIEYTMDTALHHSADIAQGISNVAFAVVDIQYADTDGNISHHITEVGTGKPVMANNCQNSITAQMISDLAAAQGGADSFASYGAMARVDIARPFAAAQQGARLGISDNSTEQHKLFATAIPESFIQPAYHGGVIYSDDTERYDAVGGATFDATFAPTQALLTRQMDQLNTFAAAATATQDLGSVFPDANMRGLPDQQIYFTEDSLTLAGTLTNDRAGTVVVTDGDVHITQDLAFEGAPMAFVVRGGDLHIAPGVTQIEGVFIIESGQVLSSATANVSPVSNLPLSITGMLIGGDPSHLFAHRTYIGQNPTTQQMEPSVRVIFDGRLLSNTPPALDVLLGQSWAQR